MLLFFSWQSDRPDCRNLILSTVDIIPQKTTDFATVTVDRDTVNIPGSPDIGDTIFEKIEHCDLYIADITLINDAKDGCRRMPNPNVLIELGYAIKAIGWDRILLLHCEDYGEIEDLPFDINHRRIGKYTLGINSENEEERKKKKQNSRDQVLANIVETIKLLLANNMLHGGKKRKVPKFEITGCANSGGLSNMVFKLKNVSSIIISNFRTHELSATFSDGTVKILRYKDKIGSTSLATGESTDLMLNNQIIGYGEGHTNAYWPNIDLKLKFSCEDEEGNIFCYEMTRHISDAAREICRGIWQTRYIG